MLAIATRSMSAGTLGIDPTNGASDIELPELVEEELVLSA